MQDTTERCFQERRQAEQSNKRLAEEQGLYEELLAKKNRIKALLQKEKNHGRRYLEENKNLHNELRDLQVRKFEKWEFLTRL
jgi:hypothetical protein